ncbi:MAG: sugar phosphate isomerase/epimerase [Planctomycetota bacterium]|nr:sugar phosphate isomerase/epimerase [Planctomycetota bacterium]
MSQGFDRRGFLASGAALAAGFAAGGFVKTALAQQPSADKPLYQISLAEWSLHKTLQKGELNNLDFAKFAKQECGIDAVEYVNQFFKDKAKDQAYLSDLKKRAADQGVTNVLIMIDGEGALGDPDEAKRTQAVENHYKWVEAAKFLGCHSIRVNAQSNGSFAETLPLAADGLRRVCEFADPHEINVIVENHGGLSSNGAWLASVMELVEHPRVGTLPDFGNFRLGEGKEYDRYKGVMQLMPYAKAVSAKSHDFDDRGNETHTDYQRMMGIVTGWGYDGFVGIEYEGSNLPEKEGIMATKKLLETVRDQLSRYA